MNSVRTSSMILNVTEVHVSTFSKPPLYFLFQNHLTSFAFFCLTTISVSVHLFFFKLSWFINQVRRWARFDKVFFLVFLLKDDVDHSFVLLFCKHRQSFAGLFLTLQNRASLSLRPNSFFLLPKMYIMITFWSVVLPSFQFVLWCIKDFWQHTHRIPRNVVLVWITTADFFIFQPYSLLRFLYSSQNTIAVHRGVSQHFVIKNFSTSVPVHLRGNFSMLWKWNVFFFVVLFSVNQIAYDNIHAIWSSVHNVCIR